MKFSRHCKYVLIGLLIILNIVIRMPSVPHEIGNDGFTIHILANSVSSFGYAKWWANSLSIFGLYPYSYASAVPFLLSGISQCTGIEMEPGLWLFCIITGFFSMLTAYLLAGLIRNDDFFKFLVAFSYALLPGIVYHSTWNASTRGFFVILLPLFFYSLLKIQTSVIKYGMLSFILFIILMATHHYFYMIIPFIFIFVILTIFNVLKGHFKFEISRNLVNIAFIIVFGCMLAMPFFTYLFIEGGRYSSLDIMLRTNVRYSGVSIVFAIGGFIYLSLKPKKKFEEWFLLLSLLTIAPLLYLTTYTHYFILIFTSILMSIGLLNVAEMNERKKKCIFSIIVISLLLLVSFSGFYQHWRTNVEGKATTHTWYMKDTPYAGALWIKDNINTDKRLIGNDNLQSRRIFAISEVPTFVSDADDCMFVYGFINIDDVNITKNSPLTTEYYMVNPYVLDPNAQMIGWYRNYLQSWNIDSDRGQRIITKFGLSYAIENADYYGVNMFIRSLYGKRDELYDNGKIQIWNLD